MFKLTLRGVVPIEEVPYEKQRQAIMNEDDLCLDRSDIVAIYIAAMQTIMPIVLYFAVAYLLAILFITEVWIG
jgi:hypothetical protein